MTQKTLYRCRVCSTDKFIPEEPLNPEPKIRTGCTECQTITSQYPVGTPHTLPKP